MNHITKLEPHGEWSQEQRKQFHVAFNHWLSISSEHDYLRLMSLREQVAPGEVCSVIKLVRSSFARPDLSASLPASLIQLMQERNLLQASFAVTSAAG
ncbi:hypothetical protein IB233_04375 [Comamonas sp. CMM01]|uniref:hypothetical protein n=1 Tax=Comamonas sp. CMM01 TaxID=2769280 RepID=UPI001782DBF0|nr:hypothetical protein [Comamonas sp. CMM01]MBD9530872.1 hypothetical protein [Comamonas sp. CMM01]